MLSKAEDDMPALPTPDRRKDLRHWVTGHAVLRTRSGFREVFGGVVNVSAAGIRLRVRPDLGLLPGDSYDVVVEVSLPSSPPTVPPVRLQGRGVTVWCAESADRTSEVALRFEAPLHVCDVFSQPVGIGPAVG